MRHALIAALLLAAACTAEKAPPAPAGGAAAPTAPSADGIQIKVTEEGFEPSEVRVEKGKPATLVFTRVTDKTCITAIDIPDEQVKALQLPLGRPVRLAIAPKKAGVERFHCSAMGMGNGRIVVVE